MRCRACNAENINSAKFCRACGAGLKGPSILGGLLSLLALMIAFIGLGATALTAFQVHQQQYVDYARIPMSLLVFIVPGGALLAVSIALSGLDSRTAGGRINAAALLVLALAVVALFLIEAGFVANLNYLGEPEYDFSK